MKSFRKNVPSQHHDFQEAGSEVFIKGRFATSTTECTAIYEPRKNRGWGEEPIFRNRISRSATITRGFSSLPPIHRGDYREQLHSRAGPGKQPRENAPKAREPTGRKHQKQRRHQNGRPATVRGTKTRPKISASSLERPCLHRGRNSRSGFPQGRIERTRLARLGPVHLHT